jgi:hypothetical protein
VRILLTLAVVVIAAVTILPGGCQRVRAHLLLSLLRESERPVEIVAGEPLGFRFPPTPLHAVALIDLHAATNPEEHVSFLPPPGSDRYAWAVGLCDTWQSGCLEGRTPVTLSEVTYAIIPEGLVQIEPRGAPAALASHHLYGLALFGDKLFALKVFYRDEHGIRTMDGWRFAEAVTGGDRAPIRDFFTPGDAAPQDHTTWRPPSTVITVPVTNALASIR